VYQRRNELMEADDISDSIKGMQEEAISAVVRDYIPPQSIEDMWDVPGLEQALQTDFAAKLPVQQWLDEDDNLYEESLVEKIVASIREQYEEKCQQVGPNMRVFEKQITLQVLDNLWKEHLAAMDHLRQGIGLRGYGGKNPKQE